ncbi:hypothetical protein HPB47_025949 [Ixodes persulcatus]|uniref:Uncharacterized protein n=1 Tax=Ixodes persulcatus TaxID=34615 RepID=A0AC60Q023_IXOPE|nr:hypothetical protein HPB47_025949 [Ixodes persulcatus]
MPGNEKAHLLARETLYRAPDIPRSAQTFSVALPSLESYRRARRVFPPLHTHLTRHQGTILRNAQSNTLPTPARIHLLRGLLPELTTATTLSDQVYLAAYIQSSLEYATRGGLD